MRLLRLALAPLGIAFGLAVEWAFYDSTLGRGLSVADFVVGSLLIVAGSVAWDRRRESWVGALMTLAGFTWFLGNAGGAAVYFHRGPLVHLVLSYPSGRLRGNLARIVVAAAYVGRVARRLRLRRARELGVDLYASLRPFAMRKLAQARDRALQVGLGGFQHDHDPRVHSRCESP